MAKANKNIILKTHTLSTISSTDLFLLMSDIVFGGYDVGRDEDDGIQGLNCVFC